MADLPPYFPDFRQLFYFSVVAQELNLHRASERLFIAQPPLSRQIRALEETLGVSLFVRNSKGLSLTAEGEEVLRIVGPALKAHAAVRERLQALANRSYKTPVIGFTTAFEQGVFATAEAVLRKQYGEGVRLVRRSSPRLAEDVRKKKVDAALVALPLEADGLSLTPLDYEEDSVLVLPERWSEAQADTLSLSMLNGKPFFWFRREANPAFYDASSSAFEEAGFAPLFREEPAEHDVLLARIAAGEAFGLFAASFSVIQRDGVVYRSFAESSRLAVRLGLVTSSENHPLSALLREVFF